MRSKKDLEETLKEKVSPLLEKSMEKTLGISIPRLSSDITDKLKNSPFMIYIPSGLNFSQAKKHFKKEFFKRELRIHLGNVSLLAKELRIDRRSVHRLVKEFSVDIHKLRHDLENMNLNYEDFIKEAISSTLKQYEEIIQPKKILAMYENVPDLSRNIAKFLPHPTVSWKDIEQEFERHFLSGSLQENDWNVNEAAKKIGIRAETLHRKIRNLGLKKE